MRRLRRIISSQTRAVRIPWTVNAGPYEFKVPQDSYLLLGDNRNGSSDARVWEHTYVSKDDILAKAIFRYYPFDRFGAVK